MQRARTHLHLQPDAFPEIILEAYMRLVYNRLMLCHNDSLTVTGDTLVHRFDPLLGTEST